MEKKDPLNVAVLILAAGASTRMGQPKQLLTLGGKLLLQRIIDTANEFGGINTTLVLGAHQDRILPNLNLAGIIPVYNKNWAQGMGTSLSLGLKTVLSNQSEVEALIVLLGDQPFVEVALLHELVETFQNDQKAIIACQYNNSPGVPALFAASAFSELLKIKGNEGARKFIRQNTQQLSTISFPDGQYDIDTPEEYQAMIKAFQSKK